MDLDFENIEIDKKELIKQTKEQIKETGEYAEVHIVIGCNEEPILPTVKIHNVSLIEVAKLIMALEQVTEQIKKNHPDAELFKIIAMRGEIKDL